MLSAKNLNAIEDTELSFIVGSRISKASYDVAAHFERHGNVFDDGQVLESARVMGTGKAARSGGSSTIARAFLVAESAMGQRITRAKAKIKAARIP